MAFTLQESVSALIPNVAAAVANFAAKTAVGSLRFTNVTATNRTISVWFDYDGTSAGNAEKVQHDVQIPRNSSVTMPGAFVFSAGGCITAVCSAADSVTMHYTPATF